MSLSETLVAGTVLHMRASVGHARRGPIRHSFRYDTDYFLIAPEYAVGSRLFSRNRFNLLAIHDRDHGGQRGAGEGVSWAREQFGKAGLACGPEITIALLTQPRLLGHWFTPVSFWLALEGDAVRAAIAEVNNTFGQRHSYLCFQDGFRPMAPQDSVHAQKVFHVSPFQDVGGHYTFNFAISETKLGIRILYENGENGLDATMSGPLVPLTSKAAIAACLRRPGGSLRVAFLIGWNALKLKFKGARYRSVPKLPDNDISR